MHNLRINIHTLTHVRNALCCDACFAPDAGFGVERAGIGIAQPFTVGPGYHAASTRFALVGINPGSGNESWKEARAEALFRFKAATTDQQRRTALQSFFDAFLTDLPNFSVPSPAMLMSHLRQDSLRATRQHPCLTERRGPQSRSQPRMQRRYRVRFCRASD